MRSSAITHGLVGAHVWVGLGAAVQTYLCWTAAVGDVVDHAGQVYSALAGFAAAGFYTIYRAYGARVATVPVQPASRVWVGASLLSVAGALLATLPVAFAFGLAVPTTVAIAYGAARYFSGNAIAFGLAKPFVLAAVWTWVVAYVPSATATDADWPLLSSRFCFFLSIGLISDYKDKLRDELSGLKTFSAHLSRRGASVVCVALMLCSAILEVGEGERWTEAGLALASTSVVGAAVVCYAFRQNPPTWYYDLVVDGLLILAGVFYTGILIFT